MTIATPSIKIARTRASWPITWRRGLLIGHAAAVYAFLYVPILVLVAFSFSQGTSRFGPATLDWYRQLWRDRSMIDSAETSLEVAALSTVISAIIGTLAALALARPATPGRRATRTLLYLPVIIPEVVVGAALLTFFARARWDLGFATIVIAHIGFSISYVAIVVRARLAGFDPALEEAAMDLGAGPVGTFFRVKLPLMVPGIVAGALLAFTISIDDYVITSFVAGSGAVTLPMQIYSVVTKFGVTPEINAVSAVLLAFTVACIALAQWLVSGKTERGAEG